MHVNHTTIMRWVFLYVPEYERQWNRRTKPVGSSWRVDETYIRTRPRTGYLYRADDKQGKTVESLLQTQRGIAPDRTAAVTLAGIELAHRIRKRQFKFGPGRGTCWSLNKQWDTALS